MKLDESLPRQTFREWLQSVRNYVRNHPFNSGFSAFILFFIALVFIDQIFPSFYHFYEKNALGFLVGWLIILGVLTGYAAKLRGRSMMWGILLGIGLIIIAILPIREHKNEEREGSSAIIPNVIPIWEPKNEEQESEEKKSIRNPTKPGQCLYCDHQQDSKYKYCQKCSEEM